MGRILSIDYGLARMGLALSDERKILASSLPTLIAEKDASKNIQKLLEIVRKNNVEAIIVGFPLHLNGKSSPLSEMVKAFVEKLKMKLTIPVHLWDERLTTVQAEKVLQEGNLNRKKRSTLVDSVAAIILLQSYLDSLCSSKA